MTEYTAEDFANAKFAEHPNGIIAARLNYDKLYPWLHNCDEFTDVSMARGGWVPVPPKPTITESEFASETRGFTEGAIRGFYAALELFDIEIVNDPKPTNAERLEELYQEFHMQDEFTNFGEWANSSGVKAPEVDNG